MPVLAVRSVILRMLVVAVVVGGLGSGAAPAAGDPDALWHFVHDQCVPNQLQHREPAPCARVSLLPDEEHGYAVFKDSVGARQYLLIPTGRISGIESVELTAPGAPNYFALAWRSRSFVEQAAGGPLPRAWLSLAVNAANARSQNQLHIHIDCLRADVHDAITAYGSEVGPVWSPFPVLLAGHTYDAVSVRGEDLGAVNPFALLAAAELPDTNGSNLVVVGADDIDGEPGFVVLANRADDGSGATAGGEELQDHDSCPVTEPLTGANSK